MVDGVEGVLQAQHTALERGMVRLQPERGAGCLFPPVDLTRPRVEEGTGAGTRRSLGHCRDRDLCEVLAHGMLGIQNAKSQIGTARLEAVGTASFVSLPRKLTL